MDTTFRSTLIKLCILFIGSIGIVMLFSHSAGAANASLGNQSPWNSNSAPSGIFHHRMRYNELGQHNRVKFDVYMNNNQHDNLRFTRDVPPYSKLDCYTRLKVGTGTEIVELEMRGTTTITERFEARYLCDDSSRGMFGRNFQLPMPRNDRFSTLEKYYVSVTIRYIDPDNHLDRRVDPENRNAIGFIAKVTNDSSAMLAPVPDGNRHYSVLANKTGGNSSFSLPFALPCGVSPGAGPYTVTIYDADANDYFGYVEAEVYLKGTDIRVPLTNLVNGTHQKADGSIDNNFFRASNTAGNKVDASFNFVPQAKQKYVLKISQLFNGNTVDIGLPNNMSTIYGALLCKGPDPDPVPPASVSIEPVAAISQSDIEPGEPTSAIAYASVNDFPDLNSREWPYNEVARQRAVNTGQNATRVTYNARQGEEAGNVEADKQIQCADGVYRAPVNCADLGIYKCNDGVGRDSCGTYNWRCDKTAAAGGGFNYFNSGSNTRAGISRPGNCRTADQYYDIQCSDGAYRNPNNCADLGTFQCNDGVDRDSCAEYNWYCSWNSDSRYVNYSANTQSAMNGCKIYKYYCKDTNGNYISSGDNWQYRTFNNLERAECNNKWDCPAPSPVVGFGSDDASAPCKIFRCYVTTDVSYGTWYEPDGLAEANKRCDFRCGDGTGDHAILSTAGAAGKWDEGDMNCYYQPTFTIGCYISDGVTTTTVYDTVTSNGNWCNRSITVQGSPSIGGVVCATTTVFTPPNGAPWPGPGKAVPQSWSFSVAGPDSDCVRVVSKPTFKVFGGDVSAGATFASTTCTNDFSNSSIVGWSGSATGYNGSHTEFGAFASGSVFGFASAKRQGGVPSSLTFANTSVSGERFGGDFGAMPCITNHAGLKPADAPGRGSLNAISESGSYEYQSPNINSPPPIVKGRQIVIYRSDDLYINNNISYERGGWSTLEDIPALKVVVTGDIHIAPGVTELNGVYVAQPRDDGSGGRIFTCAGVANNDTFNNCNQTLTVNGAFIAKRVVLGRSFGTQRQGTTAEVFRYLPELWLTKWPQAGSSNSILYDSMTNLAPIL